MTAPELASRLRLVAITNRLITRGNFEDITRKLIDGGVTAVMLRERDLSPANLYQQAVRLAPLCREAGITFLLHNSLEVALAAGADGVHLGHGSIPPARVRALAPPPFIVGYSAHSEMEIERATQWGMDYCTLSPVFYPTSKEISNPMLGLEGFARIAAQTPMPLVALGGIAPSNARACIEAGAVGVAAIGTLYGAEDPRGAAAALIQAIAG
ncbi:MAG: thiamine-phosphate pyrophosphorylase [Candidatus Sumerlaeota bacterium]|nr:thiamine-phosphate pyrophosphorylase [Candidatus Sumerlaeota bacterium]